MSRNGKGNWPMQRRGNYGGAGGEARPDEKMSRRKRSDWPYFNLWSIRAYGDPGDDQVTKGMRQLLKHVSRKKRRQRDKQDI